MQFTLAAAALIATASASGLVRRTEYEFNSSCDATKPLAKVVNRCDYPVYLWSIEKQLGCPAGQGLVLEKGQMYNENLQSTSDGGISIKISKYEDCGSNDHTQLEYHLTFGDDAPGDYLDMSFVNCQGLDCPGRTDGYYFKAGNDGNPLHESAVNNEHCPIFNVDGESDVAAVAYINPDDRQTKFCANDASIELYLCGGEAPGSSDSTPVEASSSSEAATSSQTYEETPTAASSSEVVASSAVASPSDVAAPSSGAYDDVAAAAITPAPEAKAANVMTTVVYETVYVDAKKRHAHARRHQHYHA